MRIPYMSIKQAMTAMFFFLLTACSHSSMLTKFDYEKVERGTSISTVIEKHGDPSDIRFLDDGSQEYVYIERVEVSPRITEHVLYVFKVKDEAIVDKEIERDEPLPVIRFLRRSR